MRGFEVYISIHALLAESDGYLVRDRYLSNIISIHALLAESDPRPVGESHAGGRISIHALLAESDLKYGKNSSVWFYFYPRSPCGERPMYSSGSGF